MFACVAGLIGASQAVLADDHSGVSVGATSMTRQGVADALRSQGFACDGGDGFGIIQVDDHKGIYRVICGTTDQTYVVVIGPDLQVVGWPAKSWDHWWLSY